LIHRSWLSLESHELCQVRLCHSGDILLIGYRRSLFGEQFIGSKK
jgi:hypothetical protein